LFVIYNTEFAVRDLDAVHAILAEGSVAADYLNMGGGSMVSYSMHDVDGRMLLCCAGYDAFNAMLLPVYYTAKDLDAAVQFSGIDGDRFTVLFAWSGDTAGNVGPAAEAEADDPIIFYASTGEQSGTMPLENLVYNFLISAADQDEQEVRYQVLQRGFFNGTHDCGAYVVLNLAKLGLAFAPAVDVEVVAHLAESFLDDWNDDDGMDDESRAEYDARRAEYDAAIARLRGGAK
jgi:hypothetical protein